MAKENSKNIDAKKQSIIEKNKSWKPKKTNSLILGSDGLPVAQEISVHARTRNSTICMSVAIFFCLLMTGLLFLATKLAIGNNVGMVNRRDFCDKVIDAVDNMTISTRYYVATKDQEYLLQYEKSLDTLKNANSNLDNIFDELSFSEETRSSFDKLNSLVPELFEMCNSAINLANNGELEEANEIIYGVSYNNAKLNLEKLGSAIAQIENKAGLKMTSVYGSIQNTAMFLLALGVIITFVLELLSYNSIKKHIVIPLGLITELYTAIADGDLSFDNGLYESSSEIGKLITQSKKTQKELKYYMKEIGRVVDGLSEGDLTTDITGKWIGDYEKIKIALESILQILNKSFGTIIKSSNAVTDEAVEVSNLAVSLSQSSTEQAATIEEISAAIADISAQIKETDESAANASMKSRNTRDVVEKGSETMKELTLAMEKISESSSKIAGIIKAIDDIAFQTNILALNAAVEAARAGVHGKGFAVVADEVRNLALKSSNAAKDTTALIQKSIDSIKDGMEITRQTAEIFNSISAEAEETTLLAENISSHTKVEARTIDEISSSMEQISSVVQTNSATSEESAASSEDLSAQAKTLTDAASYFRLKASFIDE